MTFQTKTLPSQPRPSIVTLNPSGQKQLKPSVCWTHPKEHLVWWHLSSSARKQASPNYNKEDCSGINTSFVLMNRLLTSQLSELLYLLYSLIENEWMNVVKKKLKVQHNVWKTVSSVTRWNTSNNAYFRLSTFIQTKNVFFLNISKKLIISY